VDDWQSHLHHKIEKKGKPIPEHSFSGNFKPEWLRKPQLTILLLETAISQVDPAKTIVLNEKKWEYCY
jgi:hypothetical protein